MSVLFGKPTNILGEPTKELILKGSSLKFQWGNKFIELIKEGKLNVEKDSILKEIDSIDSITKDGIYLVDDKIIICINNNKTTIEKAITSYISYLEELTDLTPEQKQTALLNSGFYYKTLEEAKNAEIKSGIIFVLENNALYIIKEGELVEFKQTNEKIEIPSILNIEKLNTTIIGNNNENYISFENNKIIVEKEMQLGNTTIKDGLLKVNTLECNNITSNIFNTYSTQDNIIINYETNNVDSSLVNCYLKYPNKFRVNDIIYIDSDPIIISYNGTSFEASDYVNQPITITYKIRKSESEIEIKTAVITDLSVSVEENVLEWSYDNNINKIIKGIVKEINNDSILLEIKTLSDLNNKKISGSGSLLPSNTIILYYGEIIPYGWIKCDGTNNTPSLPSLTTNVNYIMKL